jgi:hypothetical protein
MVNGSADGVRQGTEDEFGALAEHTQHPVAVFFADVGDVDTAGFEDPQAK